ncbi:MAG: amino acid adenylation domain-containing protein, partial [Thermoguttaceae bacterium]
SFRETMQRVRQSALNAFQHQEMPFEGLVEALNPERDTSRHPLFQVLFTLQNAPWPKVRMADLTISHVPLDGQTAKFDLWLSMRETEAGLQTEVEYNVDLFDAATIERMMGHLESLLESISVDPDQPIGRLPIQTDQERRQILLEWNDTAKDYPNNACLHQLVEAQVARSPKVVAVDFEGRQLTFAELNHSANRLARHLARYHVRPDMPVGVCLERSPEMVIGLLAIPKAGGAYAPLDPDYPPDRLAFMIADSRPAAILTTRTLAARLPVVEVPLVYVDEIADALAQEDGNNLPLSNSLDDVAYVIYTSGSTGKPKGVRNTHRGICNRLLWMQEAYGLTAEDRVLQKTPYSFDVSVWEFFWPLIAGARLVLAQPGGHKDPGYLVGLIAQQRITTLHFVPSMLAIFLDDEQVGECRAVKRVICSGEALSYELQQRFFARLPAELHNLYGPTEAAVDATFWRCRPNDARIVPIGRPIANTECYILDSQQNPVPVGCPGELHLGGVGLARDYLNRPELTVEKFIPHPFSSRPGARLYRTGDLCRWLPDGNIEFLGRLDYQVKIRGFRIELGEIEAELDVHPGIRQSVVVVRSDVSGGPRLVAYLVPQGEQVPTAGELREFLRARLPDFMVPAAFVTLESMPLTTSGKVNRKALPAVDDQRPDLQVEYVAPRNDTELRLAEIWQEVLNVDRVGIHDNFFGLGGHSLLATQVVSRIVRRLHADLPLREMFQAPTIAELAERVYSATTGGPGVLGPPILPVPRDAEMLPSFTQEALWFLDQLERGRATYTIYSPLRIEGRLNLATVERALNEIVRRHEALRTRFPAVDGRPIQLIEPAQPRPLPLVDLSRLPKAQRELRLRQWIIEEMARPIDLQNGPLIRITMLRLSENDHVAMVSAHHMIYDGWSMAVLLRELTALYAAFEAGRSSPLPELPLQHADFAAWQRQWLQGEHLQRLMDYWVRQRAGVAPLELPID